MDVTFCQKKLGFYVLDMCVCLGIAEQLDSCNCPLWRIRGLQSIIDHPHTLAWLLLAVLCDLFLFILDCLCQGRCLQNPSESSSYNMAVFFLCILPNSKSLTCI